MLLRGSSEKLYSSGDDELVFVGTGLRIENSGGENAQPSTKIVTNYALKTIRSLRKCSQTLSQVPQSPGLRRRANCPSDSSFPIRLSRLTQSAMSRKVALL